MVDSTPETFLTDFGRIFKTKVVVSLDRNEERSAAWTTWIAVLSNGWHCRLNFCHFIIYFSSLFGENWTSFFYSSYNKRHLKFFRGYAEDVSHLFPPYRNRRMYNRMVSTEEYLPVKLRQIGMIAAVVVVAINVLVLIDISRSIA